MAHIHEKIDFTVDVFIVHQNKVLLRMHDKYKIWLVPGGHIELNEDPNQGALREVKEEVGLDVQLWNGNQKYFEKTSGYTELIPPVLLDRHTISPTHEHISFVYFATSTTDQVNVDTTAGDASTEWKWATKEDLATMDLKPSIRFTAEEALRTLGKNN